MKIIKVIMKWIGIVVGLFFMMIVGIFLVAKHNAKTELAYTPTKSASAATGFSHNFDIDRRCKEVASIAGGSYQIEQNCRDNERKAQSQIDSESIPPEIKKHCQEVAEFAGGSYQIMLGCSKNEIKAKNNLR